MGLAGGLRKYLSLEPLGMKLKKMSGAIIFLFCNLLFVIVFGLMVCFLLEQWPMTTDEGDNTDARLGRRQSKCVTDENDKSVLITGIIKWNPFPKSLSNKCRIRTYNSTSLLDKTDEKPQVLTFFSPLRIP